jgi:hypothetical protein
VDLFGWGFLVAAASGLVLGVFEPRSRTVTLLFAAIALQSAALFILARRAGADRPYMALKMVYLAIYPMAVAGSIAFAGLLPLVNAFMPASAATPGRGHVHPRRGVSVSSRWGLAPVANKIDRITSLGAAAIVLALTVSAVRSAIHLPRPKPAVSQPLFLAADWARRHLKPECVDYVVNNVYSAYWLHIAMLRNARAAPRSVDDDTYQPEQGRVRWIQPDGLPYAIAEDFGQLPRDLRTNVDVVARFGSAAVVKRRGRAACAE